jgi:hypothetical protein
VEALLQAHGRGGKAAMAVVPLAVLPPAVAASPILQQGHFLPLVLQWALIMSFPVAIAVFAASRSAALHRRAFDAERRAEQIGQYALKRKFGAGGMGEVYCRRRVGYGGKHHETGESPIQFGACCCCMSRC